MSPTPPRQETRSRVGGASSAFADIRSALERDMVVVFPIAALLIALVLGLLLRSVVAPLYLLGVVSFVMATVLVPSLSALIGKRVWWPGHQDAAAPVAAEKRSHSEPRPSGEPAPVERWSAAPR